MIDYVNFVNKIGLTLTDNKYLESKISYNIGTYVHDCDECKLIIPTERCFNFDELDQFIINTFPNIPVLKYRELYNTCVTNNYYTEGDYYDGKILYLYFICDVEKLYNFFVENKFIINYENN